MVARARLLWSLLFFFLIGCAFAATKSSPAPTDKMISREDVQKYYEVTEKMDAKQGDLFAKLVDRFGYKDAYTPAEVQFPLGPKKSKDDLPLDKSPKKRELPGPPGAYSSALAHTVLQVHAARTESTDDLVKALIDKYGYVEEGVRKDQVWYIASELRDVEANGAKNQKADVAPPRSVPKEGLQPIVDGIRHFMIRQSWSDLLYSEDPSVGDNARKKIDDLVGASFSYSHNFDSGRNDWSAVGALIFPIEWRNEVERNGIPELVVLAPSVTVNRVTNADPKKETDEMYYRLGGILKWVGPKGLLDTIQLRGAGIYGTDTENEAELPAYEVELEPGVTWLGYNDILNKYFKIGYANILIPKKPEHADEVDQSILDYQFRIWMRAEGGDLEQAGTKWNVVQGSFERLGPSMQFRINAPTIWKGVSFTALYSYLPAWDGPDNHNMLLKLDGTLTLSSDPVSRQKISLNADYTRGGLDFTKQDVNTFTLGLSLLF
jgi:hypothetical protein